MLISFLGGDLENVMQSEVSQKEKQILCINTYMWNLESGVDDLICKADTKVENKYMDPKGEKGVWEELGDWD